MNPETPFTIFPAIDLRDGKVVRLAQGDPARQTIYGGDPLAWAERWQAEGAAWLHVINLSAAFQEDSRANFKALTGILSTGLMVEYGGGLRDEDSIRAALEAGVQRVFLGTAAILDPALLEQALSKYGPEHIAGDIGAREGLVTIRGWQQATPLSVAEAGRRYRALGLEWCVLTDVSRDGLNSGVNIASALELQKNSQLKVVASGGVSSLQDVSQARECGLAGIIIGRALYDGRISLKDCLTGTP